MDYVKPAVAMGTIGLLRFVDTTDETTITYIRIVFAIGTLLSWAVLGVIYLLIQSRNDTTPLTVQESDLDTSQQNPLQQLFGGDAPAGKAVDTTVKQYDETKLNQTLSGALMTPAIIVGLHLYGGYIPPMAIQSVLPLVTALTSELARIYIWAPILPSYFTPLPKELRRPFKAAGFMSQFKSLKKDVMQQLNEGKDNSASGRRNKRDENRKRVGK